MSQPDPKHPPHSSEAEAAVLGAMLVSERAAMDVVDMLSVKDFFTHENRELFAVIVDLLSRGKGHDYVVVGATLRANNHPEATQIHAYACELAADTTSTGNAKHYAEIVRQHSQMRSVIAAGSDIMGMGYSPDGRSPEQIILVSEERLNEARATGRRGGDVAEGYDTLASAAEKRFEEARNGEPLHGLYTGFTELDKLTNGLYPGDLIVIGGRPSMGKTCLALNIAEYRAEKGDPAGVFSMEMTKDQLFTRSIASIARIDMDVLRKGNLDLDHWDRYARASGRLRALPIRIDETRGLTMLELRTRAKRMKLRWGIKLLVVDYIQLMATMGKENRTSEIGDISRGLKIMAGELSLPVIALSQLSRGVEARDNKRPRMSDLRESGGIEQDADVIAFVYRDEVYHEESADSGTAEIIIAKQRNGPTGMVRLSYQGRYSSFENLAPGWRRAESESHAPRKKRGFGSEEPQQHWSDR